MNENDELQKFEESVEKAIRHAKNLSDEFDMRYLGGHDLLVLGQGRINTTNRKRDDNN